MVEPTHLKKYGRQNGFIIPNFRGEHSKKKIFELPPPGINHLILLMLQKSQGQPTCWMYPKPYKKWDKPYKRGIKTIQNRGTKPYKTPGKATESLKKFSNLHNILHPLSFPQQLTQGLLNSPVGNVSQTPWEICLKKHLFASVPNQKSRKFHAIFE